MVEERGRKLQLPVVSNDLDFLRSQIPSFTYPQRVIFRSLPFVINVGFWALC